MHTLENGLLKAVFDEKARLVRLENLPDGTGNIIEKPTEDAFFLNCKNRENWENAAFGHAQDFTVEQKGNTLVYHSKTLRTRDGENQIDLTLSISLEEENLCFDASIGNRQNELLVLDFEYPKLGVIKKLGAEEPALFAPVQEGLRINRVGKWLSERGYSRENNPYSYEINYPGGGSMHWMALQGSGQTLYAACHDEDFYTSQMRADGSIEDPGAVTLIFEIMPFVKTGETWQAPRTHLKLYRGTWHHGADEYKEWASTWRPVRDKPQWIRDLLGMFLVINKQQYGDEMWPYESLPELYKLAEDHGFENLSLFGWYDSGHDNQYPDLETSESLGGAETLRRQIKKVQEAGGKVTLYQQGHLIDTTTAFYRNGGYRYESRTRSGTPYLEYYNKSHRSMFLKYYTSKCFSISCPSCPEWRELMESKVDFTASFGADAVLFDQIGGMPAYPCFNEKHPHDKGKPSLSMSGGRRKLLDVIRKRTRETGSGFAFFSEHTTDLYSAWLDCVHGIHTHRIPEGSYLDYDEPGPVKEPSLFRYCFPETKITIRNPRPYMDTWSVNYAFVFGQVFEMEIRYQQDKDDILADRWPEEREYAKAVNDLRRKYINELIRADFADEQPLETKNPEVITKAYINDKTITVALWNDTNEAKPLKLSVKGGRFLEYAVIEGSVQKIPGTIPPHSIALAVFQKG
jgi:hypothetical protein